MKLPVTSFDELKVKVARRLPPRPRRRDTVPNFHVLKSQPCTRDQVVSPGYRKWAEEVGDPALMHRKQWEWFFILQALTQEGCVTPGSRGLGFGVGKEPITAYLAKQGCQITATDLPTDDVDTSRWNETNQHASTIDDLNYGDICPADRFREHVSYRPVDMRQIPDDLRDYDFVWSSCAFEHLGDLALGIEFVYDSLDCLRPGGVAVHTTEYNVTSDYLTTSEGPTVAYRKRDLVKLERDLLAAGHHIDCTFVLGDHPDDMHVDRFPYTNTHLRTNLEDDAITSYGLIIRKAGPR